MAWSGQIAGLNRLSNESWGCITQGGGAATKSWLAAPGVCHRTEHAVLAKGLTLELLLVLGGVKIGRGEWVPHQS